MRAGRVMSDRRVIDEQQLTDGMRRLFFEDHRGQFVEADGERVYGHSLWAEEVAADVPRIVQHGSG
jgi:hypothetical protein